MPSASKKRRNPRQRSAPTRDHSQSSPDKAEKSGKRKKSEKPAGPVVYPMNFAGPMRRLYAFTIDFGLIMMIVYTVAPVSGGNLFRQEAAAQDLLFFFGYFVIPTVIWGRTPGKWVAGIVVVDSDGRTPGPAAIPREMIGKFVSYIAAAIGIIWLVFDPQRQGWHDKIAGTFVVDNPYSGGPQFMKDFFKIGSKNEDDQKPESTSDEDSAAEPEKKSS